MLQVVRYRAEQARASPSDGEALRWHAGIFKFKYGILDAGRRVTYTAGIIIPVFVDTFSSRLMCTPPGRKSRRILRGKFEDAMRSRTRGIRVEIVNATRIRVRLHIVRRYIPTWQSTRSIKIGTYVVRVPLEYWHQSTFADEHVNRVGSLK